MEICIISDTHAGSLKELPEKLVLKLNQADMIIHAGDFTSMNLFEELRSLGTMKAVCGNMDSSDIRNTLLPEDIFEIHGKSVALTHGTGGRVEIAERVRKMFHSDPDIIVYGHSHNPEIRTIDGALMINPGTARSSFAWMEIENDIRAEIHRL